MQSLPITTEVVSLNSVHGEVYSIKCNKVCQLYAIGRWFSLCTPVSSTSITDRHDITEILLTVALSTINQPNIRLRFTASGHPFVIFKLLVFLASVQKIVARDSVGTNDN